MLFRGCFFKKRPCFPKMSQNHRFATPMNQSDYANVNINHDNSVKCKVELVSRFGDTNQPYKGICKLRINQLFSIYHGAHITYLNIRKIIDLNKLTQYCYPKGGKESKQNYIIFGVQITIIAFKFNRSQHFTFFGTATIRISDQFNVWMLKLCLVGECLVIRSLHWCFSLRFKKNTYCFNVNN